MPHDFDHESAREHIDAYALGALDTDDATALEMHLTTCADCTREAERAREDASRIGLAVPLVAASPVLKSRIMASAGALEYRPAARRPMARTWWAAAAAGLILAAGGIAWGGYTQRRMNDLQSANDRASAAATAQSGELAAARAELAQAASVNDTAQSAFLEIATAPDLARLQMISTSSAPAAAGRYVWSRTSGLGALVATHLPPLDAGTSYCLWIVYEKAWVYGGLFEPQPDGSGHVVISDFDGGQPDHGALRGFAVTVEPSGPPPEKHSGATILQANIN